MLRINTIVVSIIFVVFGLGFVNAELNYGGRQTLGVDSPVGADVKQKELLAYTVESWDNPPTTAPYGWEVVTNRDNPVGPDDKYNPSEESLQAIRKVKVVPGYPGYVKNIDTANAKVLGVMFYFAYPGFNSVTIRPPRVPEYLIERTRSYLDGNNKQKKYTVYGVELPGVVREVSVWVLGRGNEYKMEGKFEDWMGNYYIYSFGSLDFVGWRPLSIKIPVNVPQFVGSFPTGKTLVFHGFKIESLTHTSGEEVVLFFDELRVLTDSYSVAYSGDTIDFDKEDCLRKQKVESMLKQKLRECKDDANAGNTTAAAQ